MKNEEYRKATDLDFGPLRDKYSKGNAKCSGKPEENLKIFLNLMMEDGIKVLTVEFVNDDQRFHKTNSFIRSEKDEIVDFLMNNEEYRKAVTRHFEPLFDK